MLITAIFGYLYQCIFRFFSTLVTSISSPAKNSFRLIKQPFQIIKAANNGKTDADLLAGAGFTAYLESSLTKKADGSYDFEKATPVIIGENGATEIFTDERGYACSIPLPFGSYIVRETTTPHNYHPVDDFRVTITENHPNEPQVWRVLLDKEFKAKLKIMKKDDETKKSILSAGTEFKVYDLDNQKYVEQVTTYPVTTTHKSYFTDSQGLLTLLYDSGARVQELADLRVGDLRLEFPAQVKLTGKGRKTRSVPLMDKTTALLKNYLLEQHLDSPSDFEHPLFYNSQGRKLTRQGIAYILKKYAVACEIEEISPHKIRHTKAMHLTEADVNPIFIRDFLGHTDLKVTEVYSKTSIKMKKAALDKMKPGKDVLPDKPIKDWTEDKSLLDWLNGLMH